MKDRKNQTKAFLECTQPSFTKFALQGRLILTKKYQKIAFALYDIELPLGQYLIIINKTK